MVGAGGVWLGWELTGRGLVSPRGELTGSLAEEVTGSATCCFGRKATEL